jgi:hypothetical protein
MLAAVRGITRSNPQHSHVQCMRHVRVESKAQEVRSTVAASTPVTTPKQMLSLKTEPQFWIV